MWLARDSALGCPFSNCTTTWNSVTTTSRLTFLIRLSDRQTSSSWVSAIILGLAHQQIGAGHLAVKLVSAACAPQPFPLALAGDLNLARTTLSRHPLPFPHP